MNHLTRYRNEAGFTIPALAEVSGIEAETLLAMESGERSPETLPLAGALSLAKALRVSPEALLAIREYEEKPPQPLTVLADILNNHTAMFKSPITVSDLSSWFVHLGFLSQKENGTFLPTEKGIASGILLREGRRRGLICLSGSLQDYVLSHAGELTEFLECGA